MSCLVVVIVDKYSQFCLVTSLVIEFECRNSFAC
jgi:hypothetical protein